MANNNQEVVTDGMEEIVKFWALRMMVKTNIIERLNPKSSFGMFNDVMNQLWGDNQQYKAGFDTQEDFEEFVMDEYRAIEDVFKNKSIKAFLPDTIANNMTLLTDALHLNDCEQAILLFFMVYEYNEVLNGLEQGLEKTSFKQLVKTIGLIIGFNGSEVDRAFHSKAPLIQTGLIKLDRSIMYQKLSYVSVKSASLMENMIESNDSIYDLFRGSINSVESAELSKEDFNHISEQLDILVPYLRQAVANKLTGVNVLLYGLPGTGKTQLSYWLKDVLDCDMLEIKYQNNAEQPISYANRLGAYMTAQKLFIKKDAVLLFDEAESLLLSRMGWSIRGVDVDKKAWLNKRLENNPLPTIWVSNVIDQMDPAFVRRFDVVLEMPVPDKSQKAAMFKQSAGDLLSADFLNKLADNSHLTPAVIAKTQRVMSTVMSQKPMGQTQLQSGFKQLLSSQLKAQGYQAELNQNSDILPATYSTQYINVGQDLGRLADQLKNCREARLCLYGPPGTGKTAYAYFLAEHLQVPIVVKKASDLLSKWLGDSEKNMAAAFKEAREKGALLLIDEADSFFQDRENASKSFHVTQVNEMLTQLERFDGLFVASTNLMDNIDKAAMRRFDMKLCFDYLLPDQVKGLFSDYCELLELGAPNDLDVNKLKALSVLTPGDFSCVARQHRFAPLKKPADLVEALYEETRYKQPKQQKIGFIS